MGMAVSRFRLSSLPAEIVAAFKAMRAGLIAVAAASTLVNLLMLVGPIFMLQVYDRVLPSRSVPTLIGLLAIAAVLLSVQGAVDAMRSRLLSRMAEVFDESMRRPVFDSIQHTALHSAHADGLQTMRDLDGIRTFLAGNAVVAVCDLPWTPIYIIVCTIFHPAMGLAVLMGALALCAITVTAEMFTRKPTQGLVPLATARRSLAETAYHHAEVVHALGIRERMAALWSQRTAAYLAANQHVADMSGGFGSASRFLRMTLQSGVLAVGAYLVINQEATAGVMLAATILSIRALAPIELAIANWRGFIAARAGFRRICERLSEMPPRENLTALPRPTKALRVTSAAFMAPRTNRLVLRDVSFTLNAGSAMAVVGPSGSGKSTLARALIGVVIPAQGVIRIDGAALSQWDPNAFGQWTGYLPQDVALFEGTVAQNVARFSENVDPKQIIAAAHEAGVHELILRLPNGYQTEVGDGGTLLSGGQRQRIALARALFDDPFLVVLDEPNSNLDAEGERALARCIGRIRARGGIVIVIAHRPALLSSVDQMLVLNEGRMHAFGPMADVIKSLTPATAAAPIPAPASGNSIEARPRRKKQKAAAHE